MRWMGAMVLAAALAAQPDTRTYAILFVGATDARHEVDRNATFVNTVRAYDRLIGNGVAAEDIVLLYDGKPPVDDPAIAPSRERIEQAFAGRRATRKNLIAAERTIESRMDGDDRLIIVLNTHGDREGTLSDADGRRIRPSDITAMLKGNRGDALVVVDACHSGTFIRRIGARGTFVSSSTDRLGWVERELSFTSEFFSALYDVASDRDRDGIITYREAFDATQASYTPKGIARREFIDGEYRQGFPRSDRIEYARRRDKADFKGLFIERK